MSTLHDILDRSRTSLYVVLSALFLLMAIALLIVCSTIGVVAGRRA